ncbi:aldehyde dehydrogenase family protein [Methylomonas paludis]|uniref:Aldehyde dehydrogenase family protein n=1 Tax=Methylomonas paludis TaxID=1173101 RepID=A0A975MKN3_9GAMM|nr:aldehyde dehydrogenase family protein [Methylomonas paludis]QWF69571.1 aldehyde dehydrogenase family protein [Methylomonas paludis]
MTTFPIYLAGEFCTTAQSLAVISPYSGQCVYQTYSAGIAEFEIAVQAAQAVQAELAVMPVYQRYQILQNIAAGILAQREAFALIMAREAAKPYTTALAEVERAAQTFLIAAEEAKRLPGEVLSIDWHVSAANKQAIVKYFPVGLVAGISPFNFPLNLVAHKLAPAIAAGCPMVLKPASKTPISALLLAKVIAEAGLPGGALSVLPMDRQVGNLLVTDSRFNLLSFTGSPDIGWQMKRDAGKKKVVLELGGNAALLVDQDADLERVTSKAVIGAFAFAGQSCIHTQRIYVEAGLYPAFIELFCQKLARLKIGDPELAETEFSTMIDEANARRIEHWVDEAVADGARLLAGGQRQGALYSPTVLTNTRQTMKVCNLEAFAPIVVIEAYTDFKQAVTTINDSSFGLQAGLFSFDSRKINYAFQHLHVGGLIVNDVPTFRADHMPYGGVKDSGLGREGPKYAIFDMLEPKLLVTDHSNDGF